MKTCSAVLTFESVDEILWCDHSNETSSAVNLHDAIRFLTFYEMKFGIFLQFLSIGTLGLRVKNSFYYLWSHSTVCSPNPLSMGVNSKGNTRCSVKEHSTCVHLNHTSFNNKITVRNYMKP